LVLLSLALLSACAEPEPEGVFTCVEDCTPIGGFEQHWNQVCAEDGDEADSLCNFCNPLEEFCETEFVGGCPLPPTFCNTGCNCSSFNVAARSCSSPCGSGPLADSSTDLTVEVDPEDSFINFFQDDGFVGQIVPAGNLYFDGGICPDADCEIEMSGVDLTSPDELVDSDGNSYVNHSLFNIGRPTTTIFADGAFNLAPGELELTASFDKNGDRKVATFANTDPLVAVLDVETGQFETFFTLANATGGEAFTTLVGTVVNEPPVADAGSDQDVGCTGETHLDGSGATDPNGQADIVFHRWVEDFDTDDASFLGEGVELDVVLPLGVHEVTLFIVDGRGATSTDSLIVTVADIEGPVFDLVEVSPDCLWPPEHKYIRFALGDEILVEAHDECEPDEPVVTIQSASSDEADDGIGDGSTVEDVVFGPEAACLRSERAGPGNGRTYTLVVEASDSVGNVSTAEIEVQVPHNQRPSTRCAPIDPDLFLDDADPACDLPQMGAAPEGGDGGGGCSAVSGRPPIRQDCSWTLVLAALLVAVVVRRPGGSTR
jgi:hypothetical protein